MRAESDQPAAEAKTHTLFMGADISVDRDHNLYRVEDVADGCFVIRVKEEKVKVPMYKGTIPLEVKPAYKISRHAVTIGHLQGERAYTPANDPRKKFVAVASAAVAAQASLNLAEGELNQAHASGRPDKQASAVQKLNAASLAMGSDMNSAGYHAGKMQEELAEGLFDAMEVSFEVSAPRLIRNPYLVIIAQYRERDAKPNEVQKWVFAQPLEPIDEVPRKVRIKQGGFPPGFELQKYTVHLYKEGGQELASNVAEKNVPLTRDEAHDYLVISYLSANKGATLSPALHMGVESPEFRRHYTNEQKRKEIFIKVSKDGHPEGVFGNESCSEPTGDAYLESMVQAARFKPALKAGQAVEGVARVKLGELTI